MKLNKRDAIEPPEIYLERQICGEIRCFREAEFTGITLDEVDQQFLRSGWRKGYCPAHARQFGL